MANFIFCAMISIVLEINCLQACLGKRGVKCICHFFLSLPMLRDAPLPVNQNGYLPSIFRTNKIQIKNWIVQLENQDLVSKTNYIYQMGEAESSYTFFDTAWKVPKYRSERTPYLDIFPIICVQMKVLTRKKTKQL